MIETQIKMVTDELIFLYADTINESNTSGFVESSECMFKNMRIFHALFIDSEFKKRINDWSKTENSFLVFSLGRFIIILAHYKGYSPKCLITDFRLASKPSVLLKSLTTQLPETVIDEFFRVQHAISSEYVDCWENIFLKRHEVDKNSECTSE